MTFFPRSCFLTSPALMAFFPFCAGIILQASEAGIFFLFSASCFFACLGYKGHSARWAIALFLLLWGGALRLHLFNRVSSLSWQRISHGRALYGHFQAKILESPFKLGNGILSGGRITAELTGWRLYGSTRTQFWRQCSDDIILQMKSNDTTKKFHTLIPGTTVEILGTLTPLPADFSAADGNYSHYLRATGITAICQCESLTTSTCHPAKGFRYHLRHLRCILGQVLVDGMSDENAIRCAIALGLGLPQFFTSETRRNQIEAGSIHIFAISGMHIGVVVILFNMLLRCLKFPLGLRWSICAICVILYTLLTGASPSSVRAMLMTLMIFYAHGRFRTPSCLNAIGLAGLSALLFNPLCIFHPGFQYSYIIVLTLLLRSGCLEKNINALNESFYWHPLARRSPYLMALRRYAAGAFFVSSNAWLAGCLISLGKSRTLALCAPIVNIPLGIMAYLGLVLCPLKIVLSLLFPLWARDFIAPAFNSFFKFMDLLSGISTFSETCLPITRISISGQLVFCLAFALWLFSGMAETKMP